MLSRVWEGWRCGVEMERCEGCWVAGCQALALRPASKHLLEASGSLVVDGVRTFLIHGVRTFLIH